VRSFHLAFTGIETDTGKALIPGRARWVDRCPPHPLFVVSAVFHYLGPSFAVLLFARLGVLGVAWLRIVGAGAVFAVWRRPWRRRTAWNEPSRRLLVRFGIVLAAMNVTFYLAIDRLPLATVGAVEFLGIVILAAGGVRSSRNAAALTVTIAGVAVLADVRLVAEPLGLLLAAVNSALFMLYVILGHRIAATARPSGRSMQGIDQLASAMLAASVVVTPIGLMDALPALTQPGLLLAGLAVAVCSSVIPYVIDQLAMARLPLSSVALMLALLPMCSTIIGAVVLSQIPTRQDLLGITLVTLGVARHRAQPPATP
jgi:inner membrane transporter RhtA